MKHFLDLTGLTQFLAKLKETFVGNIKTDNAAENAASGTITFTKKNASGEDVETTVAVKNVVTTDTEQTISGNKTFSGTVTVPTPVNDTDATTKAYVDEVLQQADAMTFKGTLGTGGTITELPLTTSGSGKTKTPVTGDTYKVVTAATYVPATGEEQAARVGDLFIATVNGSAVTWSYVPSGDEVETFVKVSDGTTAVTVNTELASGDVTFGQAAAKQVTTAFSGTYATDEADTTLPTVGAVTTYALKDVTSGNNGIQVGTKANGTNSVSVVADGTKAITVGANGLEIKVDAANGLSIDSTNGVSLATVTASTNGEGGSNGAMLATDKERLDNLDAAYAAGLIAETNATSGADIKLQDGQSTPETLATVNVKSANAGATVTVADGGVVITAVGDAARAVSVGANGIGTDITANNGIKYDNNTIKLDVDTTAGLEEVTGNKLAINDGKGITFDGTSGAVKVKIVESGDTQTLSFDANGNLGIVSITDTEINNLFNPQQAG